ncbi:GyrI-like domain-containing protein [Mucilaginibacter pedocola]|uniref:AraC family transcriptional regulator n=1 Tax=Mucilaginibacter pedocola TaxID=1792845 RepID=A0A1S9PM92_9SPHI|nr:GyrI-like domain-containing protein [Mucilaginibacter pedocola]OOQ61678.1 AraC family transcriptional regulator [Mucilaginibacter pedocola]
MEPRLEALPPQMFAGKHLSMSYADNKTGELWRSFMPIRKRVTNAIGSELYSIEVYPAGFFTSFDANALYEKWAAVEVRDTAHLPCSLDILNAPGGLYAVFVHYGPAANGAETYRYIFTEWFPASNYEVDERPHFAIMGEKYMPNSADSEEEIWIPVRLK